MQSGILHAAEKLDFKTAFSYFFEAFEGFDLVNKPKEATSALKYMLLCKIMLDAPDETTQLIAHKHAVKYLGDDVTAMCAIATAAKNRSLREFNEVGAFIYCYSWLGSINAHLLFSLQAFGHYRQELQCDAVVRKHFNVLSDTMLEKELCRLIEPYSYVQIAHIAERIALPADKVEKKLAQMILDKKFEGKLRSQFQFLHYVCGFFQAAFIKRTACSSFTTACQRKTPTSFRFRQFAPWARS